MTAAVCMLAVSRSGGRGSSVRVDERGVHEE